MYAVRAGLSQSQHSARFKPPTELKFSVDIFNSPQLLVISPAAIYRPPTPPNACYKCPSWGIFRDSDGIHDYGICLFYISRLPWPGCSPHIDFTNIPFSTCFPRFSLQDYRILMCSESKISYKWGSQRRCVLARESRLHPQHTPRNEHCETWGSHGDDQTFPLWCRLGESSASIFTIFYPENVGNTFLRNVGHDLWG
jgi:hypothetical protein